MQKLLFNGRVVIRYENGRHVLNAPTGEQVHFKIRRFSNTNLLDIDVFVPSCGSDVIGLLGDADGDAENDIRAYNDLLIATPIRTSPPRPTTPNRTPSSSPAPTRTPRGG